jgi:hypothetical protein
MFTRKYMRSVRIEESSENIGVSISFRFGFLGCQGRFAGQKTEVCQNLPLDN